MARARTILAVAASLAALLAPALAQEHAAAGAADEQVVVRRAVRQVRPRRSCSAASRSIARSARSVTASRWSRSATSADPGGPGFTAAQAAAIAAEYQVKDEPNEQGEVKDRPGRLADRFPPPFPNEQAARARYNAVPPDLSVIAKARGYERGFPWFVLDMFTQYQEQGVDYIAALLTGLRGRRRRASRCRPAASTTSISPAMPSAMPPPLTDERVEYTDGAPTTVEQYAKDISAFLMWAAEPHLEARKRIGLQVIIFLHRAVAACSTSPRRRCGTRWNCTRTSSRRVRRRNIRARELTTEREQTRCPLRGLRCAR